MKTKLFNLDNKSSGDVELNDAIFGLEPRADLIQRVVVWQLAKRRSGQHKVLTRAEVNRTKKKYVKQKGSGGARHGGIRHGGLRRDLRRANSLHGGWLSAREGRGRPGAACRRYGTREAFHTQLGN